MDSVKERITKTIQERLDDSSCDEILQELAFVRMVERGLRDSKERRVIGNDVMERRIRTWQE